MFRDILKLRMLEALSYTILYLRAIDILFWFVVIYKWEHNHCDYGGS